MAAVNVHISLQYYLCMLHDNPDRKQQKAVQLYMHEDIIVCYATCFLSYCHKVKPNDNSV